MLTTAEIKQFIEDDATSEKKRFARKGQAYYDGINDIKQYRLFYYNADGNLVEDKTRSNMKIAHNFFMELVDQTTQYILSGKESYIKSDIPELQTELDAYFNENEDFEMELTELLNDCQIKGFAYLFAYKNAEDKTAFQCADAMGVVEIEKRFASDGQDHTLFWYIDKIDKDGKKIKRIMDWDSLNTYFYVQTGEGNIEPDNCFNGKNVKPHVTYQVAGDPHTYYENMGFVPFFRLDNNKKQVSDLSHTKDLIDDYDLMNCGLSNNLIDFDTPIHVVKGFMGDNLDELQQNLKTKKIIGVDEQGGVEVHTVDIPYQARLAKLQEDEKNIYKFGFGLNIADLKDSNATTNVAIKTAYSRLDLKANKIEKRLKQLLRKILKVVLDEINEINGTDYKQSDVYFDFTHEIMSNAQENAQIELVEAQTQQTRITTLLNVATQIDSETLQQQICDALDLDYDDIKSKLPDLDESDNAVMDAQGALDSAGVTEGEAVNE